MKVLVTNIQWDTECDDGDPPPENLPDSVTIDLPGTIRDTHMDEWIGDVLSDSTGFCVFGFNYEVVSEV